MKTNNMVICAVFAAVLCVFSVMTIPIGPVPISMGVFGVLLTSAILGWKKGTISVLIFILIGAVGLPVFSGFKGGFQVLLGPTGGYIWSYILMALTVGFITSKASTNVWFMLFKNFIACILAVAICYILGTWQFTVVQSTNWKEALGLCVIPFIPFDIAKSIIASYLAYLVRKSLAKAGMLK